MNANEINTLFLQQSFLDSEADYKKQISEYCAIPKWDAVILTAANETQADSFRRQLEYRRAHNRLPMDTEFMIVPDEGGKRVGSAGSTLSVIRELKKTYGDLTGKRFLTIHAGGDAKRTPEYSAIGKLFSPVPCAMEGTPLALFDMIMISMASMPGRMSQGMLLLSGDVILLFNPLMCDFGNSDAAIITFKEDVHTGKDHGVCIRNAETGNVRRFMHKQSIETLQSAGAVDERGNCNIDTGAIMLSTPLLEKLYTLTDTQEKYAAMVNDRVRLSLYGDIAYCMAEESTLEKLYLEQPEGAFCEELTNARHALWEKIGDIDMKCLSVAPAKFVHFGSVPEVLRLETEEVAQYANLGWQSRVNSVIARDDIAGYNAILSPGAKIGKGCYLEVSHVHSGAVIGEGSILSFVDIRDKAIPAHVLLHALKQKNGKFVCRIMGITDNPKQNRLFGRELDPAVWEENADHTLWTARLYPECDTIDLAIDAALMLYRGEMPMDCSTCKSLATSFLDADAQAAIDWNTRMEDIVRMERLKQGIHSNTPLNELRLDIASLSPNQLEWLARETADLNMHDLRDFSYAIRLYAYLGEMLRDERYSARTFGIIRETIQDTMLQDLRARNDLRIARKDITVRLPLRVNWGGGWTDTCPYCLEKGGTVLNAAITLEGRLPVEVCISKIPERKIVFDSRDMDVHGEFTTIEPLIATGDPFDPFALQKACLLACGILPLAGGDLAKILESFGGGFVMSSRVIDVPKGSGLGTSSILSAATAMAIYQFFGIEYADADIYNVVLTMEQIMSTGGGWQDQVGAVTDGIKFITSHSGLKQTLDVQYVRLPESMKNELSERFALIYTGQRRLARNLLRDVVGSYVKNDRAVTKALKDIQQIAVLMKFALEKGNMEDFCELLNRHWEKSKIIDAGSSNTLIEQILLSVEDLIDAKMICGAGGGGFLQVILKKGITRSDIQNRLKQVFQEFPVSVWKCELV